MTIDAVLIDDNPFIRATWERHGQRSGKHFRTTGCASELLTITAALNQRVPLFIDVELEGGTSGKTLAVDLHQRGFQLIYLATAYHPGDFRDMDFLAGVIGKEPPAWLLESDAKSQKLSNVERKHLMDRLNSEERKIFARRMEEYQNALYGIDGSLWFDGIGTHLPEPVMDAWERGIYEGLSDANLKARIQEGWRTAERR